MTNPLARRLQNYTRLSGDDLCALDALVRGGIRRVQPRRDLIGEGECPRSMYVVLDGWACRYKELPDGRRQVVGYFLPGNICDLHIYVLRRMDHSVGAVSEIRVAEVGREELETLLDRHPRISQALLWDELVMVATQREWTLNIGQRTAYERLAHLLLELFVRLESVGMTRGESCGFPLTQSDLAEATGLTSVHVNRMLQELRREKLIELGGRRLTILDRDALARAAMFNDNYLHLGHEGAQLNANV